MKKNKKDKLEKVKSKIWGWKHYPSIVDDPKNSGIIGFGLVFTVTILGLIMPTFNMALGLSNGLKLLYTLITMGIAAGVGTIGYFAGKAVGKKIKKDREELIKEYDERYGLSLELSLEERIELAQKEADSVNEMLVRFAKSMDEKHKTENIKSENINEAEQVEETDNSTGVSV